jgi:hypothetical protein
MRPKSNTFYNTPQAQNVEVVVVVVVEKIYLLNLKVDRSPTCLVYGEEQNTS